MSLDPNQVDAEKLLRDAEYEVATGFINGVNDSMRHAYRDHLTATGFLPVKQESTL